MSKQELIDYVVDGHVTDICEWMARDMDSLQVWLTSRLGLEDMSEDEIREKYGVYLPEVDWDE